MPTRGRGRPRGGVTSTDALDAGTRAAPYRNSPAPGDWFSRDENWNVVPAGVAPSPIERRAALGPAVPARNDRAPTAGTDRRMVTFEEPPSRPLQPPSRSALPPGNAVITRKDVVYRPPGQRIGVSLQQILVNVQNPETKAHLTVNGLIDTGSNHTAISLRLASKLGVDGVTSPYRVVTFGGEVFHQQSKLVRITLRSTDGRIERTVMVRSVAQLCGDLRVWAWNDLKQPWPHLRDVQFPDPVGDLRVDVLIGTENTDLVRVTRPDVVGRTPQDPVLPLHRSWPGGHGSGSSLARRARRASQPGASLRLPELHERGEGPFAGGGIRPLLGPAPALLSRTSDRGEFPSPRQRQ